MGREYKAIVTMMGRLLRANDNDLLTLSPSSESLLIQQGSNLDHRPILPPASSAPFIAFTGGFASSQSHPHSTSVQDLTPGWCRQRCERASKSLGVINRTRAGPSFVTPRSPLPRFLPLLCFLSADANGNFPVPPDSPVHST